MIALRKKFITEFREILTRKINDSKCEVRDRLKDGRYQSAAFYWGVANYLDHVLCLREDSALQMYDDAKLMAAKMVHDNADYDSGIEYGLTLVLGLLKEEC